MSYQTALSGLDWSMVPSGMSIPAAGISAMTTYESGMGAILASNNVGALNIDISSSNYTGTIVDITNEIIAISGTTSSNRTVTLYFNASTQNGVKSYKVYIPSASLVASSGGPYTLIITTGSGSSVYVPISANGDALHTPGSNLLFNIYIDSIGNVTADSLPPNFAQILNTVPQSTTSTTFVDIPGFSITFTPRTTKVKISFNVICGMAAAVAGYVQINVNGTLPYNGRTEINYNSVGSADFYGGSADANNNEQSSGVFIMNCTPNQLLTVKMQWAAVQGGTMWINTLGSDVSGQVYSCRAVSSILVEEIW